MTLLAPAYLVAAAVAAGLAALLHLLVRRRPPSALLPTARFIPDVPAAATTVATRPSDVPLLLLRVLLVLVVGLALAGPRLAPARRSVARVVAVDLSRAADPAAVLAAARPYLAGADAAVAFDSAARPVPPDSLAALDRSAVPRTMARGRLSAALVVALREASRLRDRADSVALVVVTPALAEEADAATAALRALWPGRVDVVRVAAAATALPADAVRVEWADSGSAGWVRRAAPDAPNAVRAGDAVLVAPLVRRWTLAPDPAARVVARWTDGAPAAVERAVPGGCARSLGFALPDGGDVGLRPAARRLAERLRAGPCGDALDPAPMGDAALADLRGAGPLARAADFPAGAPVRSPLPALLLALALPLLLAEHLLRRARRARGAGAGPAAAAGAPRGGRAA